MGSKKNVFIIGATNRFALSDPSFAVVFNRRYEATTIIRGNRVRVLSADSTNIFAAVA
jgi:hypothetical protein